MSFDAFLGQIELSSTHNLEDLPMEHCNNQHEKHHWTKYKHFLTSFASVDNDLLHFASVEFSVKYLKSAHCSTSDGMNTDEYNDNSVEKTTKNTRSVAEQPSTTNGECKQFVLKNTKCL